jgi:hypothetical protein
MPDPLGIMSRPFSRRQALQNAAFLAELRRTGNVRDAARTLGLHRAMLTKRRAAHPGFAAEWDAALAVANAALASGTHDDAEPRIVRTASGKLQLRARKPGDLTPAAEQAFLTALAATANIRLSAAAAGYSHATFYARARAHAGFAREMRLALERGYERLELALLESVAPDAHRDDHWRHNAPAPMPPMSPEQALQLLYLHQKEARLLAEPPHLKRRRGETSEAQSYRFHMMYQLRQERRREEFLIAEAARRDRGEPSPFEPAPPILPALDQVTGWSSADPSTTPHNPRRALFGGWRLDDIEE